jgi:hypothetical protein
VEGSDDGKIKGLTRSLSGVTDGNHETSEESRIPCQDLNPELPSCEAGVQPT